jgi:hypothetical protein
MDGRRMTQHEQRLKERDLHGRAAFSNIFTLQDQAAISWAIAEIDRLRGSEELLRRLVARLDEVHAHPRYQSVWKVSYLHGNPYDGPTYTAEIDAARAYLAANAAPDGGGE